MPVATREERRQQTRAEVLDAAERLFTARGFHATSLDAVAEAAGYTKGAVYSNFAGKEDLFFAVYERRVGARAAEVRALVDGAPTAAEGLQAVGATIGRRTDDGWMAVFFEFWAHVLRRPEHRERFAALHREALGPFAAAVERVAAEEDLDVPVEVELLATAQWALGTGLQLERLTRPDEVDAAAVDRVNAVLLDDLLRRRRQT